MHLDNLLNFAMVNFAKVHEVNAPIEPTTETRNFIWSLATIIHSLCTIVILKSGSNNDSIPKAVLGASILLTGCILNGFVNPGDLCAPMPFLFESVAVHVLLAYVTQTFDG